MGVKNQCKGFGHLQRKVSSEGDKEDGIQNEFENKVEERGTQMNRCVIKHS